MFSNKIDYDYSKPFVVLNLKAYAVLDDALHLAKIAAKVQKKTDYNIIICPEAIMLKDIAQAVSIPVYAQHSDPEPVGKSTGSIVVEHLKSIGVIGSLLNHSEKPIPIKQIAETIIRLKAMHMKSIVCVRDEKMAAKIASLEVRPDFIAVEPPELVGGEISVSTADPELIKKTVQACHEVPLLIGAGIKDNNDLVTGLRIGARGVLLAVHFVTAPDPEEFLIKLLREI